MKGSLQKALLGVLALTGVFAFGPSESSATSLEANTHYNLNGAFKLYFHGKNGAPSYAFEGTYLPGADLATGVQLGNTLLSTSATGTLSFNIYSYDESSGSLGGQIGSASGALLAGWNNLSIDSNSDVAAGIKYKATGGAINVDLHGSVNNQNFDFSSAMAQTFAQASLGQYGGVYDNLVSAFGGGNGNTPVYFSIALGDTGIGVTDALLAWFYSADTYFLGQHFSVNGDLTTRYSDCGTSVPEPASLALLGMGLVGGIARRRQLLAAK